ncbi:MAG: SpoIIE family protein phosphatase [Methanothrix soehngenii]|jgi:sigma-B regulation protein RsbU (phosphoserine phosphatase)|nr:SpoIIE family protein phosphatase [Methanothrix soehngenii]
MERMAGINGLGFKIFVILAAFALLPLFYVGIVSLLEMDQASRDVQENITQLSVSLNRSALLVMPNEADQVQLAIAKANQYNEFFGSLAHQNELVASYASSFSESDGCVPPGIWIAPTSSNFTPGKRNATIRSLCVPARVMKSLHETEPVLTLSYIGTEDGVLVTWPYSTDSLKSTAPFSYKDTPNYALAKSRKKTIWTGPYENDEGDRMMTITTPFFREGEFAGIMGMDVSIESIFTDLSMMRGRGYPFIIDGTGLIVARSNNKPNEPLNIIFGSENLSEAASPEVRAVAKKMLKGSSGSAIVALGRDDGYVAYSPITTPGWILGIAYASEEMSLPARFIDAGIKEVASSATQGLSDSSRRVRDMALSAFAITVIAVLGAGFLIGRRIEGDIDSLARMAEKISRGDFDVRANTSGELADLAWAFNSMASDLKHYAAALDKDALKLSGSGMKTDFIDEVKNSLVSAVLPEEEGYEIEALYNPSSANRFDLYDVSRMDDKIALAMAGVGGDGIQAAMLAIMSRALIRACPEKMGPSNTISKLNSQISQYGRGTNLACFYALLDPSNHVLEYVNAGFNPPFIVDPGGMVDTLGGGGIALGMLDRLELEETCIPVQPGDVMVIYSDGVVEAENEDGEPFGLERLINLVINNRTLSAEEILWIAEKEIQGFSVGSMNPVDLAMIVIKRR